LDDTVVYRPTQPLKEQETDKSGEELICH